MGIYTKKIENMFQDLPEIENVLQKYDNVTYHIQFFMVPRNIQFEYMKEREHYNQLFYNAVREYEQSPELLEQNKIKHAEILLSLDNKVCQRSIVIAESGVTNTINIESLSMITHPPASTEQFGATTVEMELKLSEINSSSLTNKVALASYLCGYESYCYQQYFVSIWFTGYDAQTGAPIDKIPLDREGKIKQCLYQVTMGDVKTHSESNKTTYTIKLYPSFYSSLSKEVNLIGNIGEIDLDTGGSFESFVKTLEDKVNEKLKIQYGKEVITNIYKGLPPLSITVQNNLKDKKSKKRQQWEEENSEPEILLTTQSQESLGEINQTPLPPMIEDESGNLVSIYSLKITPENSDTIISVLQKMMSHYVLTDSGEALTSEYNNVYVGNYKNVAYFKHQITIGKSLVPGLKDIQENVIGNEDSDYAKYPSKYQESYLKEILQYNLLQKKYYWMYNGKNTNVLSVDTQDDNMWYLNLGITDLYAIGKNIPQFEYRSDDSEKTIQKQYEQELSTTDIHAKTLQDRKIYYIDDIYNYFIKNNSDHILDLSTWHRIAESNSPLNELPASSTTEVIDKENQNVENGDSEILEKEIRYKLGMENLFQVTNQKLKLSMDILGDPYWMFFGDSTNLSAQHNLVLPHLLLFQKSFLVADRFDNYEEDKLMEYNSVYTVTKIVSNFENGKFYQRLTAHVATPFIQSSKFEDALNNQTISIQPQQKAMATYEKKDGEIIHQ